MLHTVCVVVIIANKKWVASGKPSGTGGKREVKPWGV
jgi:hypothetical protein